jgi:hypothetical protein
MVMPEAGGSLLRLTQSRIAEQADNRGRQQASKKK